MQLGQMRVMASSWAMLLGPGEGEGSGEGEGIICRGWWASWGVQRWASARGVLVYLALTLVSKSLGGGEEGPSFYTQSMAWTPP